jgi:DNA replication and repair protein RecF
MILSNLELQNFRLFTNSILHFSEGINLITGNNGQGKTSILESIHYLALTKSFRTSVDFNAIKHSAAYLNVRGSFKSAASKHTNIRFYYSYQEGKQLFLDDKRVKKFSEFIGTVPCVTLTLDDLKLSYGGPAGRRKFIDILLSQVSPLYLENLKNYRRVVQQRNALLASEDKNIITKQIDIWNDQLIEYGIPILQKRQEVTDFLNRYISEQYQAYTAAKDIVSVQYKSSVTMENEEEIEIIRKKFRNKLERKLNFEIAKKSTMTGPHRDDLEFFKNGKSFKDFASQGENKTLIIVLKFLEWKYLSNSKHNKPVLLLDDIFGELDESRMNGLLHYLKDIGQAFITSTIPEKFTGDIISGKYVVNEGSVFNAQ